MLLTVTTMPPTSESSPPETEPFRVYRHTLPNGLRIWLQPRSDSESATALLAIRAGSRYEQPAKLCSFALNILRVNHVDNVSQELVNNCMNLNNVLNFGVR